MIQQLQTLPFSSTMFLLFALASIAFMWLSKGILHRFVSYKTVLSVIVISYSVLLFPKPIQLIGLFLYLFVCIKLLFKYYKKDNLIFPMLLLALPMIAMKFVNANLFDSKGSIFESFQLIFQIAGLSYIVFKSIGLYVDLRNKQSHFKFLDFLNFTLFTPTLLIGPIDRFQRFQSDLDLGYANLDRDNLYLGWDRLVKGILYKFILAAFIQKLILSNLIDDGSFAYHSANMFAYLLYLFFDFAGYSFLAVSLSNFLGINTPMNFDKPFLAKNPKELWKRWHITLGDWLNDYFFKPLFKFFTQKKWQKSVQRQGVALFLTFTLMGFWNGFELHFIVSGMLFGIYSVIHNYYVYHCKKQKRDVIFGQMNERLVGIISISIMFVLTAFAIYIFSGHLF